MLSWLLCVSATSNSSHSHLILQDFQLFYVKESLCGRAFEDDEGVVMVIIEWIEEQDHNFFCDGVKALQQRREMYVNLRMKNN